MWRRNLSQCLLAQARLPGAKREALETKALAALGDALKANVKSAPDLRLSALLLSRLGDYRLALQVLDLAILNSDRSFRDNYLTAPKWRIELLQSVVEREPPSGVHPVVLDWVGSGPLSRGDVILSVDGAPIAGTRAFLSILRKAGRELTLEIWRRGKRMEIQVTAGAHDFQLDDVIVPEK